MFHVGNHHDAAPPAAGVRKRTCMHHVAANGRVSSALRCMSDSTQTGSKQRNHQRRKHVHKEHVTCCQIPNHEQLYAGGPLHCTSGLRRARRRGIHITKCSLRPHMQRPTRRHAQCAKLMFSADSGARATMPCASTLRAAPCKAVKNCA